MDKKQIFTELVLLEDKAIHEAESKYPIRNNGNTLEEIKAFEKTISQNFEKHQELKTELMAKYRNELIEKHNISNSILNSIIEDSFKYNWELPDFKQ